MANIILSEADAGVRDVIIQALELQHHKIYSLEETKQFKSKTSDKHIDLALLDFTLNGQQCLQVLSKIKMIYPNLPVIALSCNNDIDQTYLSHGFIDYVRKPFDLDRLYYTVSKHVFSAGETLKRFIYSNMVFAI